MPLAKVEDRIHAAQLVLPKCRFDSVKCEQGLAALREFRRDWDDRQKVFKDSPRHDWASHAADAFTYLAMGWRQRTKQEPGPPRPLYKPLNSMSYDELDDEIEITYNGTKIIQAERKPRDGLTEFDLPTAFYMSEGRLCARWPYCPHRGWASCEARPAMETGAGHGFRRGCYECTPDRVATL